MADDAQHNPPGFMFRPFLLRHMKREGGEPKDQRSDIAISKYRKLLLGDPAPLFRQRSTGGRVFDSCTASGRYNVLCFFVTASDAPGKAALYVIRDILRLHDDAKLSFTGISLDPKDECKVRAGAELPAIRYIWDFDGTVSRLFGAIPLDSMPGDGDYLARRFWLLLDPALRVVALVPFAGDGSEQSELFAALDKLPSLSLPEAGLDPITFGSWEPAS